jgi:uncharacterized protein YdaU (DUF1376 family)
MAKEAKLRMMPWHPRDFIASTRHMLGPERLAFRELLDCQWINGALPSDPKRLAQTLGVSESEFLEVWPALEEHFPKDPNNPKGLLNQRLERERLMSIELRAKASAKAKQAANARWENAPSNASSNAPSNAPRMPSSSSSSAIPIRSESGKRFSEGAPKKKPDAVPPPIGKVQATEARDERTCPPLSKKGIDKSWSEIFHAYPTRPQNIELGMAKIAASKLVKDGAATWAELLARTRRYARYCASTQREPMRIVAFFGSSDEPGWSSKWEFAATAENSPQHRVVN